MTKKKKAIVLIVLVSAIMIAGFKVVGGKPMTDLRSPESMMSFMGREFTGSDNVFDDTGATKIGKPSRGFKLYSTDFQQDIGCRVYLTTYKKDVSSISYKYNKSDAIKGGSIANYDKMFLDLRKNILYLDSTVNETDLDLLILQMYNNSNIEEQSIGELTIQALLLTSGDYIINVKNRVLIDQLR